MFNKLTDFKYARTNKQALGFYIVYLLLYTLLGAVGGIIFGELVGGGFKTGLIMGKYVAVITTLILVCLLINKKKLYKKMSYIFLGIITVYSSFLGGGLLSLILVSFITTRKPLN